MGAERGSGVHVLTLGPERLGDAGPVAPSHLTGGWRHSKTGRVSSRQIDDYLAALDEPKRSTLGALRQTIVATVPEAEECISYAMPAFRLQGKVIAGFAAFKNHVSYLPHSGSVLPELSRELAGYVTTKGALQFDADRPLPEALVKKLLAVRIAQAFPDQPGGVKQ